MKSTVERAFIKFLGFSNFSLLGSPDDSLEQLLAAHNPFSSLKKILYENLFDLKLKQKKTFFYLLDCFKGSSQFPVRVRQNQKEFFEFVFALIRVGEVDWALVFLKEAEERSNDYTISILTRFCSKFIQSPNPSLDFDAAIGELIDAVRFMKVSRQMFRNLLDLLPDTFFFESSLIIREHILELLISSGVTYKSLVYVRNLYLISSKNYFLRLLRYSKSEGYTKKAFLLTLFPVIFLKFKFLIENFSYLKKHPYVLKARRGRKNFFSELSFLILNRLKYLSISANKKPVLVTRAMGGIGDLIMMRAAFKLFIKVNEESLYLRIPPKFFPIFRDIDGLNLVNIDDPVDLDLFRIYSFTDCPAALIESLEYPNISTDRVDSFVMALDMKIRSNEDVIKLLEFNPAKYEGIQIICHNQNGMKLSLEDIRASSEKALIFVQLSSAEEYRSLSLPSLIDSLTELYSVVLIGVNENLKAYKTSPSLFCLDTDISGLIASIKFADACIGVDSSLVHLARSWGKPVLAIFGPTDGSLRLRGYNNKYLLDAGKAYYCAPCWRNESEKCHYNQSYKSECLSRLTSREILGSLAILIENTYKSNMEGNLNERAP